MSNNVVVLGNVVREDPVLRFTKGGKAMCTLTICDSRKPSPESDFVNIYWNCVAYEDLAQQIADQVRKGTRLRVEGRFEEQTWKDKDQNERKGFSLILFSATQALAKVEGAATSAPAPVAADGDFDF